MQNYHDTYKSLPPAYTVDPDGNRLHSWRTLLLPYLEQAPLYQKIDLSKPWNDPVNMAAFGTEPPRVFQCPASRDQLRTLTMVVVDPQSCFPGAEAVDLKKITDGTADTLLFIEAPEGCGVEWMSPFDADWTLLSSVSSKTPLSHKQVFHAAFADGRVISLAPTMEITVRRALLTISAGDSPGDWE